MLTVLDGLPPFWRRVDDGASAFQKSSAHTGNAKTCRQQLELWTLVCSALHIPWRLYGTGTARGLYVPAMYESFARQNLEEVAAEGRLVQTPPQPPVRHNLPWSLLPLLLLVVWFGVVENWGINGTGRPASRWIELGALDAWRTLHGEPYRALTALTLHADIEHLSANLLFGSPFFILLCRRTGIGPAAALTLLAGTLGNLAEAVYRQSGHVSLGFSTALFSVVGMYAALLAADEILHALRFRVAAPRLLVRGLRRAILFLGTGVAVLALLGADPSARTDYAAHIFGLLSGILLGLAAGLLRPFLPGLSQRGEWLCGFGALLAAAGAWIWALLPELH